MIATGKSNNRKTEKTEFSFDTIENFDLHINTSIPNYSLLQEMLVSISQYFKKSDEIIYDLGCSTGSLLRNINSDVKRIGIDVSTNLLPKSNSRNLDFKLLNIEEDLKIENACIVYSVFTLQFIKRKNRQSIINKIYDGLNDGGAFIMCEKIHQESGQMQEILSFTHYDIKQKNFSPSEILKKEQDLRGMMQLNTLEENINMLHSTLFRRITTFWQACNFVGIIAVK
jgi:tRNA (cmo5U34)-methyltransferase